MKLVRHPANPILALDPSSPWQAGSVLNPCVIDDRGRLRMYYRATNDIRFAERGGYVSVIGYAESVDGVQWTRRAEPVLTPSEPYDSDACEDARVTRIAGTYLMHYTAVADAGDGRKVVRIALATSHDGILWRKHGVVGPAGSRSKAATVFPEEIGGKFWWLYTWEADSPLSSIVAVAAETLADVIRPPAGAVARTLEHFDEWAVLAPAHQERTQRGPEVGAPPIRTAAGWLLVYCDGNGLANDRWTVKAALLDSRDPRIVLSRTRHPILEPETEGDRHGVIADVTFPSGAIVRGDLLHVYYGSGDASCCLATGSLTELLGELTGG